QVRRFRPDWVLLWSAGPSQSVGVREAIRNGFPLDRLVSVIWLDEKDMNIVGAAQARGVKRFEAAVPGREHPVVQEILQKVYQEAGKGFGKIENVGSTYYVVRSEEHTSELQSRENLVCRLLLEKKKMTA